MFVSRNSFRTYFSPFEVSLRPVHYILKLAAQAKRKLEKDYYLKPILLLPVFHFFMPKRKHRKQFFFVLFLFQVTSHFSSL